MSGEAVVRDAPQDERYELVVDGQFAGSLAYRGQSALRALVHTEVLPAYGGRGLGSVLIDGALDDLRAQGLRLIPICPFVTHYLVQHPEQLDLVDPVVRRSFGLPDPA